MCIRDRLTFYLSDGGRLETRRPTAKSSASAYTSDPADPVPYIESFGERRPIDSIRDRQRCFAKPGNPHRCREWKSSL